MEDTIPERTVIINWSKHTMTFRNASGDVVEVSFIESKKGGLNAFWFCSSIAIAQQLYTEKDGSTKWAGASALFLEHMINKLGTPLALRSMYTYWSDFTSGENANHILTRIQVNGQSPDRQSGLASELFRSACGFVLGVPEQLIQGKYKLWSIKFIEQDPQFYILQAKVEQVLAQIDSVDHRYERSPAQETLVGDRASGDPAYVVRTSKVVHGVKNTPYELKRLLKDESESVFIVGQNLYTLVMDEVVAAKKGTEVEGGFRQFLRTWMEKKPRRGVDILLCDPRVKASVMHYAMVFKRDFIPHLCDAIPMYQLWQRELGAKGLDVCVTQAVPLSLVAVDGLAEDADKGVMTITPMAFENRSAVRPTFIVERKDNQEVFDSVYESFRQRLILSCTRSVLDVSEEDLSECRELIKLVLQ